MYNLPTDYDQMEEEFYELSDEAYKILCVESYAYTDPIEALDELNVIEYDDWEDTSEFHYD